MILEANLLISKDGTACLSSFGLSKVLEYVSLKASLHLFQLCSNLSTVRQSEQSVSSSHHRNPRWLAPEVIRYSDSFSTHSDVWSFAMLCLEILSGDVPYSNIKSDGDVIQVLYNGRLPDRPKRTNTFPGIPDAIWTLLRQCWQLAPDARPAITNVKVNLLNVAASTAKGSPQKTPSRWFKSNYDSKPGEVLRISTATTPTISNEIQSTRSIFSHPSILADQLSNTTITSGGIGTENRQQAPRISWDVDSAAIQHYAPQVSSGSTNDAHHSGILGNTTLDIVNVVHGVVLSGTLEGLIGKLLTGFSESHHKNVMINSGLIPPVRFVERHPI